MSAAYGLAGIACLLLATTGTESWGTVATRWLGAVVGFVSVLYGGYVLDLFTIGEGFVPVGWYGLVVPLGLILNAVRHKLVRR